MAKKLEINSVTAKLPKTSRLLAKLSIFLYLFIYGPTHFLTWVSYSTRLLDSKQLLGRGRKRGQISAVPLVRRGTPFVGDARCAAGIRHRDTYGTSFPQNLEL
jgi:hypothetical protein